MILFFDTETTGFYLNRLPYGHEDQPHIVQIAMSLMDEDGKSVASANLIVNPGVPIPAKATDIHGISDEMAAAVGVSEKTAASMFNFFADRADLIVAHNVEFDMNVMACAYARLGVEAPVRITACTMSSATPILNLPPTERMLAAGINRPKSPKLSECIKFFFDEDLEDAHDALGDLNACARVYFHIQSLGAAE